MQKSISGLLQYKKYNNSAMHLLAREPRTRSVGRPPYEDLE